MSLGCDRVESGFVGMLSERSVLMIVCPSNELAILINIEKKFTKK
jgi:uncharacterized membrane-anchored protein YitT (DUF2179 family)